ncbi:MAG: hypothetical protein M1812_003064 [Candelaria pacifica]|nr:MAG: hypothetical protein M1812_003064 [Candelaria pacifica]
MAASYRRQLLGDLLLIAAANLGGYYLFRYTIRYLQQAHNDPEAIQIEEKRKKSAAVLRRLDGRNEEDSDLEEGEGRRPRKEDLVLTQYEQTIALDLVAPEDIPITFEGKSEVLSMAFVA